MLSTSMSEAHEIIKDSFKDIIQVMDIHSKQQKEYLGKWIWNFIEKKMLVLNKKNRNIKKDVSKLARKVMILYAIGTSIRDTIAIIKELEGFDMDSSYISKSTNKLWPKIKEFQTINLINPSHDFTWWN